VAEKVETNLTPLSFDFTQPGFHSRGSSNRTPEGILEVKVQSPRMGYHNRDRKTPIQKTEEPVQQLHQPSQKKRLRKRGEYFRYYRTERNSLNILENIFAKSLSRKEYRACRFLYYRCLPYLSIYLRYGTDMYRLEQVEHDLYNQMLSYLFHKGLHHRAEPNRVWLWGREV